MKEITLEQAYHLIKQASAIIIDGLYLGYPSLDRLTKDPENEWLYISWYGDGKTKSAAFIEEDQKILFDGSTIFMQDDEGDAFELTLLVAMKA